MTTETAETSPSLGAKIEGYLKGDETLGEFWASLKSDDCECGGTCDDCKGSTVDEIEAEWMSSTSDAPIPDLTIGLPRTGVDVNEVLGVDRFAKSFADATVRGVDHFELMPGFHGADDAARMFGMGFEVAPAAADESGEGSFVGSGAGQLGFPVADTGANGGMGGPAPGPVVQTPVNGGAGDVPWVSGATLGGIIKAGANLVGNLTGNTGIHPASPIYAPEPMMDGSGIAYAPVRINGTSIDLEPNPTQWFSKHPLITLLMGAMLIYVLVFVVILAKK